jgi:hypothetical protein
VPCTEFHHTDAVQCSAVQCSAVQCSAVQCSQQCEGPARQSGESYEVIAVRCRSVYGAVGHHATVQMFMCMMLRSTVHGAWHMVQSMVLCRAAKCVIHTLCNTHFVIHTVHPPCSVESSVMLSDVVKIAGEQGGAGRAYHCTALRAFHYTALHCGHSITLHCTTGL